MLAGSNDIDPDVPVEPHLVQIVARVEVRRVVLSTVPPEAEPASIPRSCRAARQ